MANTFNHISATKTTTLIKKYIVKNYTKIQQPIVKKINKQ